MKLSEAQERCQALVTAFFVRDEAEANRILDEFWNDLEGLNDLAGTLCVWIVVLVEKLAAEHVPGKDPMEFWAELCADAMRGSA